MELLDMNFSNDQDVVYDQESTNIELDGDYQGVLSLLFHFVDNAITSQEPVDPDNIVQDMDETSQNLYDQIMNTNPTTQDRAIVTALINKYPNLDQDPRDIAEFKEHTKNLVNQNALGFGTMNYYIQKVVSGDVLDKKGGLMQDPNNLPPTDEQMQNEQMQQEQQDAMAQQQQMQQGPPPPGPMQGPPMQGPPMQGPQGQYSYMSPSFYDQWDNMYNDINYTTEEEIKEIIAPETGRDKAFAYLQENFNLDRMFAELDEEIEMENEGYTRAMKFLIKNS